MKWFTTKQCGWTFTEVGDGGYNSQGNGKRRVNSPLQIHQNNIYNAIIWFVSEAATGAVL